MTTVDVDPCYNYSEFAQELRHAVPGPFHAVKDSEGVWHVSGNPAYVTTNKWTVMAAVRALNMMVQKQNNP